ncbi:MAG: hypothetical protein HFH41_04770 [Lachnospiraceae bacterium]|nr:hypothetical protein [Lachnospiraceae bacterium]
MKRKIAMMLAVMCLMFSMSTVSQAAGESRKVAQPTALRGDYGVQPYYVNAANIAAALKIDGNTAYCNAEVGAKKVCALKITMRLQRKNGDSWYTVKSWSSSKTAGGLDLTGSYTLVTRGSYRVYAIFDVGGEPLTYTSTTKTF